MDEKLIRELLAATEAGAIGASGWIGRGQSDAADEAAVKAMRQRMKTIPMDGTIVIGEGERDEAPMLFIGERVGSGKGSKIDIAVDPLEGTGLTARGQPNALSVLAAAPAGALLHAPDTYMDKIAVGGRVGKAVSLDHSVKDNIHVVADRLGKPVDEVTAIILERDRHKDLIGQVRKAGARVRLIGDGDVFAAIATAWEGNGMDKGGTDILFGIGGAPEGVLAAAALKCVGGYMEGRLKFRKNEERERALKYGMKDPDMLLTVDDLARGDDLLFCATGVTNGDFLKGVARISGKIRTHSLVLDTRTKQPRVVETIHGP